MATFRRITRLSLGLFFSSHTWAATFELPVDLNVFIDLQKRSQAFIAVVSKPVALTANKGGVSPTNQNEPINLLLSLYMKNALCSSWRNMKEHYRG